jgi:hypothetical protein
MSVRLIQSYKFSKQRRTIPPLLGERAGVRADVILATMMSWLRSESPVSRPAGSLLAAPVRNKFVMKFINIL